VTNNTQNPCEYGACRHFVAYSGVKLPLKLVNELEESDMAHRNTYFRGYYDTQDRLLACQKIVYGEIEFEHRYEYSESGDLQSAEITEVDGETKVVRFDYQGKPIPE
jgi:hypothetical protein